MKAKEAERKGMSKHALIMLLCCLIPIIALAVLWAIGVSWSYLIWGVILLCPLMHILMMWGMDKKVHKDSDARAH